jgi:hypothetical protein
MEDVDNWEETAAYVIYKDGSYTVAVNGDTGVEDSRNTDASTVIQYAIDAITTHGKIVIKVGAYELTTKITIPSNKMIAIHGEVGISEAYFSATDKGVVFTVPIGFNTNIFEIGDASGFVFIDLQDFTINGTNQTAGHGIQLKNAQESVIRHVEVKNCTSDGIFLTKGGDSFDCDVVLIDHCRCESNGNCGIYMNGGPYCFTRNCHLESNLIGIGVYYNQQFVFGNMCIGNRNGIELSVAALECAIIGNIVNLNEREGIRTVGSSRDIISSNISIANGTSATDPYGIRLYNSTDVIVEDNICTDTQGVKTQTHGVYEDGTSDYNIICHNNLRGNDTAGLSSVGANTKVESNLGYVTENSGASGVIADGGTIAHGLATTPTHAIITGSVAGEIVNVTGLGAANLTIAIKSNAGAAGTNQVIYWRAWV